MHTLCFPLMLEKAVKADPWNFSSGPDLFLSEALIPPAGARAWWDSREVAGEEPLATYGGPPLRQTTAKAA